MNKMTLTEVADRLRELKGWPAKAFFEGLKGDFYLVDGRLAFVAAGQSVTSRYDFTLDDLMARKWTLTER